MKEREAHILGIRMKVSCLTSKLDCGRDHIVGTERNRWRLELNRSTNDKNIANKEHLAGMTDDKDTAKRGGKALKVAPLNIRSVVFRDNPELKFVEKRNKKTAVSS